MQRAYAPWYDKNSEGGAFDLRRLRNFKDAWIGDTIRYPLKQIRTPNGQLVSGRDLAREIGENRASGAPIFLPSTRDQAGNYEWDYSPPQGIAGDSGIPQWIGDLDWDILDGLLVPREVVEASTTGSGFSGRSVPLVGFLAIRDTEFGSYVRQIKGQFLDHLSLANYGPGADDFDLVPTPLIETTGELMGGMGQPDSRNAGGDGAGQEGKGQEAGGVEQASGVRRQASGSQNGGMQFGQGSLWEEDEHPRADDGTFTEKGGGLAGEKLRHFDEFAQELAKSHPELGLGDSDDAAAALWDVLGEGKRSMVAKHDPEVIDEAVRLIHASGGRNYADEDLDAVPFSTDGNDIEREPAGSPKGGQFAKKRGASKKGAKKTKGRTFVSPNKERLTFTEAKARFGNASHQKFAKTAKEIDKALGVTGSPTLAIGDWEHGAEPSVFTSHANLKDIEHAEYISAWKALAAEQEAAAAFAERRGGPDKLWQMTLPVAIEEARKILQSEGIPDRTLQSKGSKTNVLVVDLGSRLGDKMENIAEKHNATDTEYHEGDGSVFGGKSREDAIDAYRDRINSYEKKFPLRKRYRPPAGRRLYDWRREIAGEVVPEGRSITLHDGTVIQLSIADPPDRDRATSQPAKAKDSAAAAAPVLAGEIRRRLDKLLKKN